MSVESGSTVERGVPVNIHELGELLRDDPSWNDADKLGTQVIDKLVYAVQNARLANDPDERDAAGRDIEASIALGKVHDIWDRQMKDSNQRWPLRLLLFQSLGIRLDARTSYDLYRSNGVKAPPVDPIVDRIRDELNQKWESRNRITDHMPLGFDEPESSIPSDKRINSVFDAIDHSKTWEHGRLEFLNSLECAACAMEHAIKLLREDPDLDDTSLAKIELSVAILSARALRIAKEHMSDEQLRSTDYYMSVQLGIGATIGYNKERWDRQIHGALSRTLQTLQNGIPADNQDTELVNRVKPLSRIQRLTNFFRSLASTVC